MPYRRLPNTDSARIRALKTAIEKKRFYLGGKVFTFDMSSLEATLRSFETAQIQYQSSLDRQVKESQKLQKLTRNARLYVSHFIQVLNFCIIRGEMKPAVKKLYKLEIDNYTVPDLSSNEALLEVGKNIIDGEHTRTLEGGFPIYNPTIARVNVAYSLFKDAYTSQKQYQTTTNMYLEKVTAQRNDVDEIIRELWNQIEAYFGDKPEKERLASCREFGIIYYYRKGEENKEESEKV